MRQYDGRAARTRYVKYNKHRLQPILVLPSRTAWALSFQAGRRRVEVSQVIEELATAWAEAWEEQLGETDRAAFLKSIPYSR